MTTIGKKMHGGTQLKTYLTTITSCSGAGLNGGKKPRKDSQSGVFYGFRNEVMLVRRVTLPGLVAEIEFQDGIQGSWLPT